MGLEPFLCLSSRSKHKSSLELEHTKAFHTLLQSKDHPLRIFSLIEPHRLNISEPIDNNSEWIDQIFTEQKQTNVDIGQEENPEGDDLQQKTVIFVRVLDEDTMMLELNYAVLQELPLLQLQVVAISMILASTVIYAEIGQMDSLTFERLGWTREIAKNLKLRPHDDPDAVGGQLGRHTPEFVFLLRDFKTKWLKKDGKSYSVQDYTENVLQRRQDSIDNERSRHLFCNYFPRRRYFAMPPTTSSVIKQRTEEFQEFLADGPVKELGGYELRGPMVNDLVAALVDNVNEGSLPTILTATRKMIDGVCHRRLEQAMHQYSDPYGNNQRDNEVLEEAALRLENFKKAVKAEFVLHDANLLQKHELLMIPYMQEYFKRTEQLGDELIKSNAKASWELCNGLLNSLQLSDFFKEESASFHDCAGDQFAEALQQKLFSQKADIQTKLREYRVNAKGPSSHLILIDALEGLFHSAIAWSQQAIEQYRMYCSGLQDMIQELDLKLQQVEETSIEEKANPIKEEKEQYERQLVELAEQLSEERSRLRHAIEDSKEALANAMEIIKDTQQRHDISCERKERKLMEMQQKIEQLNSVNVEQKERRETDVGNIQRELLLSERRFTEEERNLQNEGKDLMTKVIELERSLAEGKTTHLQNTFKMDMTATEAYNNEKKKLDLEFKSLEACSKEDISELRQTGESRITELRRQLADLHITAQQIDQRVKERLKSKRERNTDLCRSS